ncbi:MAG: hypothetical protein R3C15_07720 [Thermoleophilia bacterium]
MRRFRLLGAAGIAALVVAAAAGAIAVNVALLGASDDDAPIGRLSPIGAMSRGDDAAPRPSPGHAEPDGDEDEEGDEPAGDDD